MKLPVKFTTQVALTAAVSAIIFWSALGAIAQNRLILNDLVATNYSVRVNSFVSGQFDCTLYDANDTTNCHTLVVGFRNANGDWDGGTPVVVLQTNTANPAGESFTNITFAGIQAPCRGTYFLWVDDVLGSPDCVTKGAAIDAFEASNPSGGNSLQTNLAVVLVNRCATLAAPTLIAPACGGTVATTTPTLDWSSVTGANGYSVVIYSGASCSYEAQLASYPVSAASFQVPDSAGLQYGQTYSWQVYALGSCGCVGPESPCCSFSIVPPRLGISLAGTNMVISWPTGDTGGFVLASTNALGPGSWPPVGTTPVVSNGNYQVTLPSTGSAGFYRLEK